MRYVVVGAGAVGGTIGGRLHQAGHDVVLLARGAHGAAIRDGGLLLRDPDAEARLDIACVERPGDVDWRDDDAAVVATKTQDALGALDALAVAAPPSIAVVCATNGLETERLALRRFARTYGMSVMLPAEHLRPGEVVAYSAPPTTAILDVGCIPAGVDEVAERIVADLSGATFSSLADDDILRRKRQKLLTNLVNVIDAACGAAAADTGVWEAARAEARACFDAAGLAYASDEEDRARRGDLLVMRRVSGARRAGGSTWQSVARGVGTTEVDYLNGEVVLLGRLHGVPTPINEALQRLAIELVTSGAEPGTLPFSVLPAVPPS